MLETIETLAHQIESAGKNSEVEALETNIKACEYLINNGNNNPVLLYFIANAYSFLRRIQENENQNINAWEWNNDYRKQELISLRKAILHPHFNELHQYRKCQIYTNLGNILSNTGRFIEAFDEWDRALEIESGFGMALIQIPICLHTYTRFLYYEKHKYLFYQKAYHYASVDCTKFKYPPEHSEDLIVNQRVEFCKWWNTVSKQYVKYKKLEDCKASLGNTKSEIHYRKWCLSNKLFVNPLNDLRACELAAADVHSLGIMTTNIGDGPYFHSMFDQMKQEFIAARYMLYLGSHKKNKKYVNKKINLTNTLDYPVYGIDVEQVKASYRIAYSILDKIASFLDSYFKLQNTGSIYFNTVWYKDKKLHDVFKISKNLPLRGLFWLSKDLKYDASDGNDLRLYLEPNAQKLSDIRNALEHGYVRVIEYDFINPVWQSDIAREVITYNDLLSKTLYLHKLIRSALIYLSLAVNFEEKNKPKNDDTISVSEVVPRYQNNYMNLY